MQTFFAELWTLLAPILATALVGTLSAVGVSIRNQVHSRFVADGYDIAAKAAAGWINTQLAVTPQDVVAITEMSPQGNPIHPLANAAVDYMKQSFPEAIAKVEKATGKKLGNGEIASDIFGALGKFLPGPFGAIAGVAGTLLKQRA